MFKKNKQMNKPITIMPLNDFFMIHKTNIQSTELDLLKCAGFEDASFYNEKSFPVTIKARGVSQHSCMHPSDRRIRGR